MAQRPSAVCGVGFLPDRFPALVGIVSCTRIIARSIQSQSDPWLCVVCVVYNTRPGFPAQGREWLKACVVGNRSPLCVANHRPGFPVRGRRIATRVRLVSPRLAFVRPKNTPQRTPLGTSVDSGAWSGVGGIQHLRRLSSRRNTPCRWLGAWAGEVPRRVRWGVFL
jgi:hypothetical protein